MTYKSSYADISYYTALLQKLNSGSLVFSNEGKIGIK